MPNFRILASASAGLFWCFLSAVAAFGQGAVVLEGGGTHVSDAAAWMAERTADKRILVLDYTDDSSSAPRSWLLGGGFTEVGYLAVTSSDQADEQATYDAITSYSAVYLPGGDQSRYVSQWRGTRTEEALEAVFASGGTLAGSSAGTAILSGVYFSASRGTVYARESLLNVRNRFIRLGDDFLGVLPGILVDTHFYERGRLARLLAMMQRYREDNEMDDGFVMPLGIGVDDHAAFVIGPDGAGEVMGSGVATIIDAGSAYIDDPLGSNALSMRGVAVHQLSEGYRFDLATREILSRPEAAERIPAYAGGQDEGVLRGGRIMPLVDASLGPEEWVRESGPLSEWYAEVVAQTSAPTVCLFTAPAFDASGLTAFVEADGGRVVAYEMDGANQSQAATAEEIEACEAYLFAGNDLGVAYEAYGPAEDNAVRAALAGNAERPYALLGRDAMLLSATILLGDQANNDAAYRGRLTTAPGPDLFRWNQAERFPRPLVVAGLYPRDARASSYQYHENHLAGGLWMLASTEAHELLLLPDGAAARFRSVILVKRAAEMPGNNAINVGAVPFFVVSESPSEGYAFAAIPQRRAPTGGVGPRQNGAFDRLSLDVIAPGATGFLDVIRGSAEVASGAEGSGLLAYPNPSASAFTLSLEGVAAGPASVSLYDLLGRRVLRQEVALGGGMSTVEIAWPSEAPSGLYLARIRTPSGVLTTTLSRVR
jgi:cyanophycinase